MAIGITVFCGVLLHFFSFILPRLYACVPSVLIFRYFFMVRRGLCAGLCVVFLYRPTTRTGTPRRGPQLLHFCVCGRWLVVGDPAQLWVIDSFKFIRLLISSSGSSSAATPAFGLWFHLLVYDSYPSRHLPGHHELYFYYKPRAVVCSFRTAIDGLA